MCKQDVAIEHCSPVHQTDITVAAAGAVTIPAANGRRSIIFSAPSAGDIYVSLNRPAAVHVGLAIPTGIEPQVFGGEAFGSLPEQPLYVWCSAALSFSYVEVFHPAKYQTQDLQQSL